jgi:hypothetical protein
MIGTPTMEQTIKLEKLPSPAKQILVNDNFDLLSD